jgi:hypothetical protein
MRISLIFLICGALAQAQELPVTGAFRDNDGALRLLEGVPGAWTARAVVREGVLSAGSNGRWLWYKTATELHVGTRAGDWWHVEAPAGPARGEFSATGEPRLFHFPEAGQQAAWQADSGTLGQLEPAWIEVEEPLEQLGELWWVARRDGLLFARAENGTEVMLPLAEAATFQLYARSGTTETLVNGGITLPAAAAGETSEAKFRIRNLTAAPVLINRLSIDPGAFTTFDQFYPPRYLEGNGFLDFSIRFTPTGAGDFSSTLYINDTKFALSASASGVTGVELQLDSGWQPLTGGSTTSLGTVQRRSTLTRALRLSQAATVTLSGAGFTLVPGASSTLYTISLTSDTVGVAKATLTVDGRTFTLTAVVTDFPVPTPTLTLTSDTVTPAQEARLVVKLSEATQVALTGVLTLAFSPASGLADDPAVAFLPTATRTVAVAFAAGATASSEIRFQTGTTAGTLTLNLTLGTRTAQLTLTLSPMAVVLTAAKASAASASAQVTLTGYDITRTISKISFTFYLSSGAPASPGVLDVDVTSAFKSYWASITGGTFQLQATFPVSGTYTDLAGVEVVITNSNGTAQTGRLTFQ